MTEHEDRIAELQRQRDEELANIKSRVGHNRQMKEEVRRAESSLAERYKRMTAEGDEQ